MQDVSRVPAVGFLGQPMVGRWSDTSGYLFRWEPLNPDPVEDREAVKASVHSRTVL